MRHRCAGQPRDALGQAGVEPLGEAHGQRHEDDLVVALGIPRLGHSYARVAVSYHSLDVQPLRPELLAGLLALLPRGLAPSPEGSGGHEQRELHGFAGGSRLERLHELTRGRGHIGNHEDVLLPGHCALLVSGFYSVRAGETTIPAYIRGLTSVT